MVNCHNMTKKFVSDSQYKLKKSKPIYDIFKIKEKANTTVPFILFLTFPVQYFTANTHTNTSINTRF